MLWRTKCVHNISKGSDQVVNIGKHKKISNIFNTIFNWPIRLDNSLH